MSYLSERCGSCEGVGEIVSESENAVLSHPNVVARHLGRIREEEEHTCGNRRIKDVHSRSAEYLLAEDNRKCTSQSQHPKRTANRKNHRNEYSTHQVALLDFFTFPLRPGKLDAKADDVAHQNLREHSKKTVEEYLKEASGSQCAGSKIVLITYIIHSEEQGRHERYHHKAHYALRIDGIMYAYSAFRSGVGHIEECVHTVVNALEGMKLAVLFKVRAYLIKIIS